MTANYDLSNSPFLRHLGSNYAPTDLEVLRIQDCISRPLERLAEIDKTMEELLIEKARLAARVDAHKALAHPIRRIPREVLQLIFQECLPADRFPSMGKTDAPVVLTQVCRLWSSLTRGMRRLWSSVHIVTTPVYDFGEREVAFHAERITQWLSLAKDEPLSISIFSEWGFEPAPLDLRVRDIILSHAQHIRELKFKVSEYHFMEFIGGRQVQWDLLEKIAVDLKPECHNLTLGEWLDNRLNDTIFQGPNLKSINFNHVDCLANILPLNWSQMEHFRVCGLTSDPARRISFARMDVVRQLHQMPRLVTLQIAVNDDTEGGYLDDDHYGPPKPMGAEIVLPCLTTLHLCDSAIETNIHSPTGPGSLLENLRLPSLEHLSYDLRSIEGNVFLPSTGGHSLVSFLRLQQQPILIISFAINFKVASDNTLIECVRLMPLLENLWVYHEGAIPGRSISNEDYGVPLGAHLLEVMYMGGSNSLCPHLSTLRLARADLSVDDLQRFCDARVRLSEASEGLFASLQRLFVEIHARAPVFVPRYPGLGTDGKLRGPAQCGLEEELRAVGVDATIRFMMHDGWWEGPEQGEVPALNPRAGLKTVEERLEEWPNAAAWNTYVFR